MTVVTSSKYPVWLNGRRTEALSVDVRRDVQPPDDFLERHRWGEPLPAWNDPMVVNVQAPPWGATGDGKTDDTDGIQRAIDENRDVFLPKGNYRISRPLRLSSDSRLIGLGVHSKLEPMGGAFADASNPAPMLIAPNDTDATCHQVFTSRVDRCKAHVLRRCVLNFQRSIPRWTSAFGLRCRGRRKGLTAEPNGKRTPSKVAGSPEKSSSRVKM